MDKMIKKVFLFFFAITSFITNITCMYYFQPPQKRTLVMLSPAGDAHDPQRELAIGYERGQTLEFAHQLKKKLIDFYGIQALLSRSPGQDTIALQTASFANRLNINFFLQIHMYKEEAAKPKIFIYQLVYNPLTDFAQKHLSIHDFIPLHLAHTLNIHTSKTFGQQMKKSLSQKHYDKLFNCYGLYGIPLSPLAGITAPALLIEIGINRDDKWHALVDAVAESLEFLVES